MCRSIPAQEVSSRNCGEGEKALRGPCVQCDRHYPSNWSRNANTSVPFSPLHFDKITGITSPKCRQHTVLMLDYRPSHYDPLCALLTSPSSRFWSPSANEETTVDPVISCTLPINETEEWARVFGVIPLVRRHADNAGVHELRLQRS